ncbi:MAG: hypothetical protein ACOZNI_00835 [Myxococcota bacterium]
MFLNLLLLACVPTPEKDGDVSAGDDTGGGTDTAPVEYETYACGWEKRDPGTLESTGNEAGDVLADLTLVDQCGESFRVWDMYEEYFILFVTAAW